MHGPQRVNPSNCWSTDSSSSATMMMTFVVLIEISRQLFSELQWMFCINPTGKRSSEWGSDFGLSCSLVIGYRDSQEEDLDAFYSQCGLITWFSPCKHHLVSNGWDSCRPNALNWAENIFLDHQIGREPRINQQWTAMSISRSGSWCTLEPNMWLE